MDQEIHADLKPNAIYLSSKCFKLGVHLFIISFHATAHRNASAVISQDTALLLLIIVCGACDLQIHIPPSYLETGTI